MLSVVLIFAAVFVAVKTYRLWQEGPWHLPKPATGRAPPVIEEPRKEAPQLRVANIRNIIDNNLFDPERGAGRTNKAESQSFAVQRLRGMVLVGTAILGNSRYAILQEPPGVPLPGQRAPAAPTGLLRLKLGDMVEGFQLTEIQEKRAVFIKGNVRVDLELDFFRKVEGVKPAPAPTPRRPAPVPRVPPPPVPPARSK